MIAFKYTKTDGAEYISHLDLLRHIYRTLRRAKIEVKLSAGFHPHPRIFMNNPLGLGIKSEAEFCTVDSVFEGDFRELFNRFSPQGIKCADFRTVQENPNFADSIESCTYCATGIKKFDTEKYLSAPEIIITDKRGRKVDIRPRIYALSFEGDKLVFTAGCGKENLRPDLFCEILQAEYGGQTTDIVKTNSSGKYTF